MASPLKIFSGDRKILNLELLNLEKDFLNDTQRIELQEKSYYYYLGDSTELKEYLKKVLRKVLGDEVVDDGEWVYDLLNITKKIINLSSVVYNDPAQRTLVNDNGDESEDFTNYFNEILPDNINSKNKKALRYAKLFNTSLTQVIFDKNAGKINLLIEPSCNYKVKPSEEDYFKPEVIGYDKEFTNFKGEKEVYTVIWTEIDHYKIDSNGVKSAIKDNEDMENPFGVLPFGILRLQEDEDFWGIGAEDVVNVNEVINFLLTFMLNDSILLGTGGIPVLINTGITKQSERKNDVKKPRLGRRHPITIEDARSTDLYPPSVSFVNTDADLLAIQNSIDYRIKQVAVLRGLNPNTILSQVKDTSDYQKMMDSLEQIEIRRDDLDPCRSYEKQLFEIIRKVNNVAYEDSELRNKFSLKKIPEDLKLRIDFAEIKQALSNQEKWQDRKEKESRNMATAIDWLLEDNPELTYDEAKQILADNKEINSTIGSQEQPSIFNLLTEGQNE